jgi:hypothetical protein
MRVSRPVAEKQESFSKTEKCREISFSVESFPQKNEQCVRAWENVLLRLKKRGLTDKQLSLITVDGNPGLLAALKT